MKINGPKIKKIGREKKKVSSSEIMFIALALVLTFVLFCGLIIFQNYLTKDVTYQKILVAKQDIPIGQILNETNLEEYVIEKEINILDTTKGNIADPTVLTGMKAKVMLYAGEDLTLKDFLDTNEYLEKIKDPVEFSFNVGNISESYGGKLRQGDYINLTMTFNDNTRYIAENVYVSQALTSDGIQIDPADTESVANILYLIVEKSDELKIKNLLANGINLNVSKPVNQDEKVLNTKITDTTDFIFQDDEVIIDSVDDTNETEDNYESMSEYIEFIDDDNSVYDEYVNDDDIEDIPMEETIATEIMTE